MDALSEALNAVRMTGAIFFHAECAAPWGFAVPSVAQVQHVLSPGTERLVNYNLVTEGRAFARFSDGNEITLRPGDLVMLPHGDAHTVSNGSPRTFIDSAASLAGILQGNGSMMRFGESGEITRFICGFFGCERSADRLFLAGLPQFIRVNLRDNPGSAWLEAAIRHLVSEAESDRPGRSVLLSRMAESLFIEALRCHMEQLPGDQTGWLAGARDPVVGGVLALLHRDPAGDWTLGDLASAVGASRSVIAKRFNRFIGDSPIAYLARWRLELGARQLRTSAKPIAQVAAEVGYESEAAFSRAFKRAFGLPPAQYRRRQANGAPMPDAGSSRPSPGAGR
ncbi:AraC family transcriptional regulator [Inquilinus sp. CA228]|uniref:AraC family transcriptional regulator n=1 Tax=Inquilinus sp. CA228 TaxID=3455609 RepID=UPI003F8D7067